MKKRYPALAAIPVIAAVICIILLLPKRAHAEGYVMINATTFPDQYFREYVKQKYDLNHDGKLTDTERFAAESIYLWDASHEGLVSSAKGIEYFPNITEFNAEKQSLTSLDLRYNTKLETLYCSHNQLTELDLRNNTNLRLIRCESNQLTALYLTSMPDLVELNCCCNKLPGLDLSNMPNLVHLYLHENPGKKFNVTETGVYEKCIALGSDKFRCNYIDDGVYIDFENDTQIEDKFDFDGWGIMYSLYTRYEVDDYFYYDNYNDFLSCDPDDVIIALDTPKVSAANTSSGIKVSWNKVFDAHIYEVWRAPKGSNSADFTLLSTVKDTSYTDTSPVFGKAYTYRICAKCIYTLYSKNAAVSITRTSQDPQNPFTDVPTSASYYNAVIWAVQNGVVSGTSATTFSPNADCTRYQLAVMLYKLAGKPSVSGTLPFTDVKKSASYYNAVLWAYKNGIISGTSNTTFSPNDPILRYQAVVMLYKMAGKPAVSGTNPFKDVSKKASYYNAVLWAVKNNITKGTDSTHFSPNAVCKRYQLVVFLYKFNNIYHYK